jgi:hypothetical protein
MVQSPLLLTPPNHLTVVCRVFNYRGSISTFLPVFPASFEEMSFIFSLSRVVLPLVLDYPL